MNKNKKTAGGFSAIVSFLAIAIALVAGALIYSKVFGDPSNFVDNDPTGEPMEGNLYGVIYKGGFIVPILVAINLIIIIFSIERLVTLLMANGKGNTDKFIAAIKGHMEKKITKQQSHNVTNKKVHWQMLFVLDLRNTSTSTVIQA